VVRRPALKLSLLGALVLVGHLLALEWLGRQADAISGMPQMAPAMYTRLLQPAAPAPVVAAADTAPPRPRARIAPRPKPPASAAKEVKAPEVAPEAEPAPSGTEPPSTEPPVAEAPAPAASEPVASSPVPPASAPAGVAASGAGALDSWPTDTRLSYALSGEWRGPLFGDARVQWQRDEDKYQVRLDVRIQVFGTQVFTSQGEVTPQGLVPRAYEEMRPGKRRAAQFGDEVLMLENGRTAQRPPGVQDTASQFVELTHRFATGKEVLEVGRTVSVWLARPGAVDLWTYDIVARETLRTPRLGDIEAFHLKPRPIANPRGNITAEMWFAPTLQYLPVRIKVSMGNEAYLDLLVDQIEQR
jgi:hypothetical protein